MIDCSSGGHALQTGLGRIRLDSPDDRFGGDLTRGVVSRGFQPIILPVAGQGLQLTIASVGGIGVAANPSAVLTTPDVLLPAQQAASVPIVVQCYGVPIDTVITVTAKPVNGVAISAAGLNSVGTLTSSTATINLNLPRGSGILFAKATVPTVGGGVGPNSRPNPKSGNSGGTALDKASPTDQAGRKLADLPYSVTGLTTDGERIAAVEAEATLGGPSRTVYVTESGKRIPASLGK